MPILIYTCTVICIVLRCFIFKQRDIKWWKALIPGYNKYLFGKSCNQKKLGIAAATAIVAWYAILLVTFIYEMWVFRKYAANASVSEFGQLMVTVPESVKNTLEAFRYIVTSVTLVAIVFWSWMMLKFSEMHGKPKYWVVFWAVCPVIPLAIIALGNTIAVDGKSYKLEKVPANGSGKQKYGIKAVPRTGRARR